MFWDNKLLYTVIMDVGLYYVVNVTIYQLKLKGASVGFLTEGCLRSLGNLCHTFYFELPLNSPQSFIA